MISMKWPRCLAGGVVLLIVMAMAAGCGHKSDEGARAADAPPPRQGLARGTNAAKQTRPPIDPTQ
jgi:hypothetical protein